VPHSSSADAEVPPKADYQTSATGGRCYGGHAGVSADAEVPPKADYLLAGFWLSNAHLDATALWAIVSPELACEGNPAGGAGAWPGQSQVRGLADDGTNDLNRERKGAGFSGGNRAAP
jgi:hypothetical protein